MLKSPFSMISLDRQSISTTITDRYATTIYSFNFKNKNTNCKELKFELTIGPNAFISGFLADIDGEIFKGITKEKETASNQYIAAKKKKENAILLSQPYADIPNIFEIKTNIDSNSNILLQITIEEYLTKKFNYNELNIQILRSFQRYNIIQNYEYIAFDMEIKDKSGIFDVKIPYSSADKSTSHGIIIDEQINSKSNTDCKVRGRIHCDKSSTNELTFKYKIKGEQCDSMILFDNKTKTFCHIISDIITDSMVNHSCHAVNKDTNIPRRVVFVIDKSGSMSGSKWSQTISSTVLALNKLRTSFDRFCIILFDNYIFSTITEIELVNPNNISEAITWLQSKSAGGGTEINKPLLEAIELIKTDIKFCNQNAEHNYFMNQIFFVTDGEVSNTNQIISNIKKANDLKCIDKYNSKISIFSFGISNDRNDSSWLNDVNHSFLKSLSLNNNGIYKRIKHSNTDKTLNEFFNILSKPVLSNINVKYDNKNIINLTQTSFNTLYSGNDLIVCGQINTDQNISELNINSSVTAITAKQRNNKTVIPVNIHKRFKLYVDTCDHDQSEADKIWAYLKLKQYSVNKTHLLNDDMIEVSSEEKKINDAKPLSLALKYQFITEWTSMIVVKQKTDFTQTKPETISSKPTPIKTPSPHNRPKYVRHDMQRHLLRPAGMAQSKSSKIDETNIPRVQISNKQNMSQPMPVQSSSMRGRGRSGRKASSRPQPIQKQQGWFSFGSKTKPTYKAPKRTVVTDDKVESKTIYTVDLVQYQQVKAEWNEELGRYVFDDGEPLIDESDSDDTLPMRRSKKSAPIKTPSHCNRPLRDMQRQAQTAQSKSAKIDETNIPRVQISNKVLKPLRNLDDIKLNYGDMDDDEDNTGDSSYDEDDDDDDNDGYVGGGTQMSAAEDSKKYGNNNFDELNETQENIMNKLNENHRLLRYLHDKVIKQSGVSETDNDNAMFVRGKSSWSVSIFHILLITIFIVCLLFWDSDNAPKDMNLFHSTKEFMYGLYAILHQLIPQ